MDAPGKQPTHPLGMTFEEAAARYQINERTLRNYADRPKNDPKHLKVLHLRPNRISEQDMNAWLEKLRS